MIIGSLIQVKIFDPPGIKKTSWPCVGDIGLLLDVETKNHTNWCKILVNGTKYWLRQHEIINFQSEIHFERSKSLEGVNLKKVEKES